MPAQDKDVAESLSETEVEALHEVELGVEHLKRAHGHLISFHHAVGRGMDHLADAETALRDADYPDLADAIRDDHLPRGVIESTHPEDQGRWSYDILETYEDAFLDDILAFADHVNDAVAGGRRHVKERRQESDWKDRSRRY